MFRASVKVHGPSGGIPADTMCAARMSEVPLLAASRSNLSSTSLKEEAFQAYFYASISR
jgi:hypothetical protein